MSCKLGDLVPSNTHGQSKRVMGSPYIGRLHKYIMHTGVFETLTSLANNGIKPKILLKYKNQTKTWTAASETQVLYRVRLLNHPV